MVVCRPRGDYSRGWKLSAAFNVSQKDRVPLDLFRDALGCGTIRKAGNDGWYFEVNRLEDITTSVVPFFDRFPLVGRKARDYELFRSAVELLAQRTLSDADYVAVVQLREQMNGGGERDAIRQRESSETIRRPLHSSGRDEIVRSHGRP